MPRFADHAVLGAGAGLLYSLVVQERRQSAAAASVDPLHAGVCAFAGFVGSCLPDVLEPASKFVGPNHRGAVHSLLVLALSIKGVSCLATVRLESDCEQWFSDIAGAFCAGVGSHLVADLTTARGLNFAAKGF
jgi:membrane-bound metal-dependent hydrolase YbcI (DUF457 family)